MTPASLKIFFSSLPTTSPVPCGAGIRVTLTLPDFPVTSNGRVWDSEHIQSKAAQDLLILIILSLAFLIALSLAGRVSFDLPSPIPTYPSPFPITAIVENVITFPSLVFL